MFFPSNFVRVREFHVVCKLREYLRTVVWSDQVFVDAFAFTTTTGGSLAFLRRYVVVVAVAVVLRSVAGARFSSQRWWDSVGSRFTSCASSFHVILSVWFARTLVSSSLQVMWWRGWHLLKVHQSIVCHVPLVCIYICMVFFFFVFWVQYTNNTTVVIFVLLIRIKRKRKKQLKKLGYQCLWPKSLQHKLKPNTLSKF